MRGTRLGIGVPSRAPFAVMVALSAAAVWVAPAAAQDERKPASPLAALEQKVSFSFNGTQLHLVIEALQKATGANIAVDPRVDRWRASVTATVNDEPASAILEAIGEQLRVEHTVWCDVIYLHPAGKAPGPEPTKPTGPGARLLDEVVPAVDFERAALSEVMTNLKSRVKGLDIVLPARVRVAARKNEPLTLKLRLVPLHDVLSLVARDQRLKWTLEGGKVVFAALEASERDIEADTVDYDVVRGDTLEDADAAVDVDAQLRRLAVPATRGAAARALIRAGKPALPKVAALLAKADPATAGAALRVLEAAADPSEYVAVLRLFQDEERSLELRSQAGMTLAAMKAPEAVPALIDALNDPMFRISETARRALVATGAPAVPHLEKRWLAEVAKEDAGQDGIIYRGLLIFGEIGSEAARNRLVRALAITRGRRAVAIRHHAAMALGYTGKTQVILPLIRALERERDFLVAKYIARSLHWLTSVDLPPSAARWRTWWDQEGQLQYASHESAGDLLDDLGGEVELPVDENGYPILESDEQRTQRLIGELRSRDTDKRTAAIKSLEAMGKQALPELKKQANDPQIGRTVKWLIARIESR